MVYGGRENNIAADIRDGAIEAGLKRAVGNVLVPTETTRVLLRKKWQARTRAKYGGYLFVELNPIPPVVRMLRGIAGTFGLLPSDERPVPLAEDEVLGLLADCRVTRTNAVRQARVMIPYEIGDQVKIVRGNYSGTFGAVTEIDEPRPGAEPIVTVAVEILGRKAPISVPYWQVEVI